MKRFVWSPVVYGAAIACSCCVGVVIAGFFLVFRLSDTIAALAGCGSSVLAVLVTALQPRVRIEIDSSGELRYFSRGNEPSIVCMLVKGMDFSWSYTSWGIVRHQELHLDGQELDCGLLSGRAFFELIDAIEVFVGEKIYKLN